MTRRNFIRSTSICTAGAFFIPRKSEAWIVQALFAGMLIGGGIWASWKLGKMAQKKLYPCPPPPAPTNAPPIYYPTNGVQNTAPGTPAAAGSMTRLPDLDMGDIGLYDVRDSGLVSPIDGSALPTYANIIFQTSNDLVKWTDNQFEAWANSSWLVMRFNGVAEQLGFASGTGPNFTLRLPDFQFLRAKQG